MTRRHHCRCCGAVACHKCSASEAPLKYLEDENGTFGSGRVCDKCFSILKDSKSNALGNCIDIIPYRIHGHA